MEQDSGEYKEYVPVKRRRALEQQKLASAVKRGAGLESGSSEPGADEGPISGGEEAAQGPEARPSLLVKATQLKKEAPKLSEAETLVQTEKEMLERLSERKELMSVKELAKGIHYTEPMVTGTLLVHRSLLPLSVCMPDDAEFFMRTMWWTHILHMPEAEMIWTCVCLW